MLTYAAQVSMLPYADVGCTRVLPVSSLDILVPKVRYFSTKAYFSNLNACYLKSAEAAYPSASSPHILVPQGIIYWYSRPHILVPQGLIYWYSRPHRLVER